MRRLLLSLPAMPLFILPCRPGFIFTIKKPAFGFLSPASLSVLAASWQVFIILQIFWEGWCLDYFLFGWLVFSLKNLLKKTNAERGSRTLKPLRATDFESVAVANFAISAQAYCIKF